MTQSVPVEGQLWLVNGMFAIPEPPLSSRLVSETITCTNYPTTHTHTAQCTWCAWGNAMETTEQSPHVYMALLPTSLATTYCCSRLWSRTNMGKGHTPNRARAAWTYQVSLVLSLEI